MGAAEAAHDQPLDLHLHRLGQGMDEDPERRAEQFGAPLQRQARPERMGDIGGDRMEAALGDHADDEGPVIAEPQGRADGDDERGQARPDPHPEVAAESELPVELDHSDIGQPEHQEAHGQDRQHRGQRRLAVQIADQGRRREGEQAHGAEHDQLDRPGRVEMLAVPFLDPEQGLPEADRSEQLDQRQRRHGQADDSEILRTEEAGED